MKIVTLDFETYFSDDYTLKKLTTEAYVRDPRFEMLGVAVDSVWCDAEIYFCFASIDWSDTALICHHAQFDGLILAHHYGIRPAFWFDTMSMGRMLHGNHVSASLGSLAALYGLAPKTVPYDLFRNKHWHELTEHEQRQVADGALHDVALTRQLFDLMIPQFPREELAVIDATIRMFTEPKLLADTLLLGEIWSKEHARKRDVLRELGVTGGDLRSSDRFADILRSFGVEPEYKDGKNGPIYAFARTDDFMRSLVEGDDENLSALASARLGERSSIGQRRAERLGDMASRGPLCVYLSYAGAHTKRWAGGDKMNFQNFPRLDKSDLRKALVAPPGTKLLVADCSQIECRVLNYLAGQSDKIEDFAAGRDPYIGVASQFYGYPVNKTDHPKERQVGKVLELQCGFGSGADKIGFTLKVQAGIVLTDEEKLRARDAYRSTHPAVVKYWYQADEVIKILASGDSDLKWGPLHILGKKIGLPNGTWLDYSTLEWFTPDDGPGYWRVRHRKGWTKLYGAKLVENVVQALARVIVSQAMTRLLDRGFTFVNTEHDSLWALVNDNAMQGELLATTIAELSRTPAWLPGIPLAAEGHLYTRYGQP